MKNVLLSLLIFFLQVMPVSAADPVVEMQTNLGTITVQLDTTKAPITTTNFLSYVNSGFYEKTLFHRIIKGFVLQGGGYGLPDAKFKDVNPSVKSESSNGLKNLAYTIGMARGTAVDSATAQFYFNLANNASLDYKDSTSPGYTVFGSVIDGKSVIDAIAGLNAYTINASDGTSLAYSADNELIYVEKTYVSMGVDLANSKTRVNVIGKGKVISSPAGIKCGDTSLVGTKGVSCVGSNPLKATKTQTLTATAASGYVFNGWSGDCYGSPVAFKFALSKNHNCTANFKQLIN
jgi:peptidyl-prolyl cis-trans isomerase A (cyclophilin A)